MTPTGRTTTRPSGMTVTQADEPPQRPIRLDCRLEELQCWLEFQPQGGDWNNITNRQADCWRIHYHNGTTRFAGSNLQEALSETEQTLAGVLRERRQRHDRSTEHQARQDRSIREARQQGGGPLPRPVSDPVSPTLPGPPRRDTA